MTLAHRRYFAVEMGIAAVINAVLSAAFVILAFGGRSRIPVFGWGGLAADAAPQSFMIALMSCLIPTLLARRRVAAGTVAPLAPAFRLPRRIATRVVVVALSTAAVALVAQSALLSPFGLWWPFANVLAFKCIYGAVLGAAVAALSIRFELGRARALSV